VPGLWRGFRPSRFDALTCSDGCRQDRHRGGDLRYIAGLDPVAARFARNVHDAIDFEIKTWRAAGVAQREGRATRRQQPLVKKIAAFDDSKPAAAKQPELVWHNNSEGWLEAKVSGGMYTVDGLTRFRVHYCDDQGRWLYLDEAKGLAKAKAIAEQDWAARQEAGGVAEPVRAA
jgi:hypothetical protein